MYQANRTVQKTFTTLVTGNTITAPVGAFDAAVQRRMMVFVPRFTFKNIKELTDKGAIYKESAFNESEMNKAISNKILPIGFLFMCLEELRSSEFANYTINHKKGDVDMDAYVSDTIDIAKKTETSEAGVPAGLMDWEHYPQRWSQKTAEIPKPTNYIGQWMDSTLEFTFPDEWKNRPHKVIIPDVSWEHRLAARIFEVQAPHFVRSVDWR